MAVLGAYLIEPPINRVLRQGIDPGTSSSVVWHESLGILVLVLTLLRLIWLALRAKPPQFNLSPRMHRAARATQGLLWLLILVTPLAALLALAHMHAPLTLLAGLRVQELSWIDPSALAQMLDWGDVHEALGNTLIIVAGAHAAAALYHHYVLKDSVLASMLPWRRG